jgi:tetratricopeptide (TPR) repeat protein
MANQRIASFSLPYAKKMGMKNEDHDDALVPSSKNSNETRTTKQIVLDNVEALQQQYEAMVVGIGRDSRNKDQTTVDQQEFFEVTCNIPSNLISILKKESLWPSDAYMVHVPTILTSTERKRRLLEIDLLQNLIHNDDETVDQLWSLWYAERDCQENATTQLYTATTYSNDPNRWKKAEQILRQLILQHGIYWVEPVNRLATLYYLQGKYQQSIDLCQVILHVKPWHFGALSGMVGLYIQMNDMTQAKTWSEKRLPSYVPDFIEGSRNSNQRRAEWVRNAVAEAKLSLNIAEQKLKLSFGENDVRPSTRYEKSRDNAIPTLDADTTSWQ